jgi:hypothetical protein
MAHFEYLLDIDCNKNDLKTIERRIENALAGVGHVLALDMAGSNDNPSSAEYATLPE